ncbi:MAG: alkaline phosphatase family protein [Phycisphaerae bacterium]|jgi:predicted AlkP superfamily phosphohydrolase/phosphomutase
MKVLIIGLDGGTWDVLDDCLLENHMPNLHKLKERGCCGILHSTEPPASPVAWTSFLTGCNPGKHGVTGFHYYSMKDNTLGVQNSTHCLVPNMYQQLSRQGYRIVSINVPWTFPCYEINGIMAAGLGFGGIKSDFTYPPDFRGELLAKIPDYDFCGRIEKKKDEYEQIIQLKNVYKNSFRQKVLAAKMANDKIDCDLMVVQFHDTDGMNHILWKYVCAASRDEYPVYRDEMFEAFESLDECVGELLNLAERDNAAVFVISDHGGDRLKALIRANLFLEKWGYLKTNSAWGKSFQKTTEKIRKKLGFATVTRPVQGFAQAQPEKLGINLKKSQAFMLHTAIPAGHLYINLKGRQPTGTVEPGEEYNRLIEKLRRKFLSVKGSDDKPLFVRVVTPGELYGENVKASERIGDLILLPRQGYELTISCSKRKGPVEIIPDKKPIGTHHPNGIFIMAGDGVKPASECKANITDIAPTVYALLNAEIPDYLDGRVLQETLTKPLDIRFAKENNETSPCGEKVFKLSQNEEQEVNRRLEELGYL